MKFTVSFSNWPFTLEQNQVIYIENEYDGLVNAVIRTLYDELTKEFSLLGYEFIYIPKMMEGDGIEDKVKYYAPYLTSKILESTNLKTSHLLNYMTNQQNRDKVYPSIIFNPSQQGEKCVFNGITLDDLVLRSDVYASTIVDMVVRDIRELNNAKSQNHYFKIMRFQHFVNDEDDEEEPLLGDPVEENKSEEILFGSCDNRNYDEEEGVDICHDIFSLKDLSKQKESPEKETNAPNAPVLNCKFSIEGGDDDLNAYYLWKESCSKRVAEEGIDTSEQEDDSEDVEDVLADLEEAVRRLRLRGVTLMAIHELIDKNELISSVRITSDYRIFLPDYNNVEIEMSALPKALFFLFLRYPEGIILKHMPDYYNELYNIYRQLRPRLKEEKARVTITSVTNPYNNAVHEKLSLIRAAFVKRFDEHLAKNYFISGTQGDLYRIPLDRNLITWEEE